MKKIIPELIYSDFRVLIVGLILFFMFSTSFASENLTIRPEVANSITLTWPSAAVLYTLQTNNVLTATNWGVYGGSIANSNGTNSVTFSPLKSSVFFRLETAGAIGLASPTNIPGMAYFWNYNDLPPNSEINSWTDEIAGVVMKYNGGSGNGVSPQTTTAFPGLNIPAYGDYIAFTSNPAPVGSNFTLWVVMRPSIEEDSANEAIFGNGNLDGINISTDILSANWGNGVKYSSLVMNYLDASNYGYGETYDILDSGGTLYSNGVAMTSGVGQPATNFQFSTIGSTSDNGFSAEGYIQYIGIWTNQFTASQATNLDNWYWNYGITNITNGLIAWWKLNDGSGTTAADSAGTNTMIFGGTGNMWTNNAVVDGGALYFNGNGWMTNSNTNLADNLPAMAVSFWLKETGLGNGAFIEKGSFPESCKGGCNPGWFFGGDGISNAFFGCYNITDLNGEGSWQESPHNSGAPDSPIVGDNNWHFIVGEYTNAAGVGIVPVCYIDGQQITGTEVVYETATNITCPFQIFIGADNGGSGVVNSYSSGTMNDVRIYNRELSLQEINDLYKWRGEP